MVGFRKSGHKLKKVNIRTSSSLFEIELKQSTACARKTGLKQNKHVQHTCFSVAHYSGLDLRNKH